MMIQLKHTRQALGHLLMRIALVGMCLFGGNSAAAFGQVNGGPIFVPTLLNGFNSLMSLNNIDIPDAAKVSCSPFGRVGTSEQRLTLSPGGTYLNGVVILTGRPADVQLVANRALGQGQPLNNRPQSYIVEFARGADSQDKINQLLQYSRQTVSLYSTGTVSGGGQRPAIDAVKAVLNESLTLFTSGAISMPVFVDLNYVTGFPSVVGNPWSVTGSPWGAEGNPWSVTGSPWSVTGSPLQGTDAEKLATMQSIAEGAFWRQWAFQDRGVGLYDQTYQRALPNTADGSGSKVVLFDTAPYTTAGYHNETRQRLSMNLCVDLVPLPMIEAPADKSGYMRDHGLFGSGLTFAVAPQNELHLVRVLDDNAVGDLYSLASGIDGFNQSMLPKNAGTLRRVIYNFSLGLKPLTSEIPTEIIELNRKLVEAMQSQGLTPPELINGVPLLSLEIPLRTAYNMGAVIIASAGNDSAGLRTAAAENVPAAYSFALGVQSTNTKQAKACYSNVGEIGAPGGDGGIAPNCDPQLQLCNAAEPCDYGLVSLVSLKSNTVGFAYWVGSSFAAPLVSGVAADALENGVTYDKIIAGLQASAATSGVVDAEAAIKP